MNPSTMQQQHQQQQQHAPPHLQQMPLARNQRQSDLMLAVALAGLGTYAFYTTLGDMQTVIYTVGSAYVLRILMQNPEIMRQVQARLSSMQTGRPVPAPLQFHSANGAANNGSSLPRIDTSSNHPSGNGYQPAQATGGLYDDFENSMATPTTPDPNYIPLPSGGAPSAMSRVQQHQQHVRPDSRTSTLQHQQRGPSPSITVATATPTTRAPPSIGMSVRPGTETFDPRASTTSTFSAFAIPMTNPFASYQHYDNGTVNGERLLSPIHENDPTENFGARGPLDTRASLVPGSGFDPRASIVSTFSAFAVPTTNPFASYTFYDAGTIGGERVAPNQQPNETATAPVEAVPSKTVSQSPYDAGAVIGQQLARRASRCYSGVTGVGLPGAGTLASPAAASPTTPAGNGVSMSEYVPKRKHRQPTVAARVGEVAPPGGGIAPPPAPVERAVTPVLQAPVKPVARPPTPGATKRSASRSDTESTVPAPTRVELPARKSTVTPLNRNATVSPLRRSPSTSGSPLNRSATMTGSPAPPVPRLTSPGPESTAPVRFFESPLVNSPMASVGGNSIHPISPPVASFVASSTAPLRLSPSKRSPSGYDSDSSHASSSNSSRRSQDSQVTQIRDNASHSRTDSLGLPSYEKHVRIQVHLSAKTSTYSS
ncbi:hypothetical protein M408DRAFT_256802 [Serendipita vermifera MAFF 305830]|uniref:Uncharacterized protein n=1 Tax=Serendipita vermifera MAFF 305830 TaxID=933852 RepID=A0A0C3BIE9_SERVB|nr:hypothetical protein M408DRAFT_256802 [Serendipita vermifera MAFF 305830]